MTSCATLGKLLKSLSLFAHSKMEMVRMLVSKVMSNQRANIYGDFLSGCMKPQPKVIPHQLQLASHTKQNKTKTHTTATTTNTR